MKEAEEILKKGGIGVLPTDTLYGLVGSALSEKTVERMYEVRHRSHDKPFIILLNNGKEIEKFGIPTEKGVGKVAQGYWPGKVSIVLALPEHPAPTLPSKEVRGETVREKFTYLHRGTNALAFRVPDDETLRALLKETGPLAAPSANPEGKLPALTVEEAKKYFSDAVDFYIDGGMRESEPSTLIEIRPSKILILREGAVRDVVRVAKK